MPRVSVIIPVYNGEKYVAQAIDSVLAQTFRDFELIVVDDSSSDNSEQIIQRYQNKLTYYKKRNTGLGPPDTMHYGFCRARGEYLAILGHDDIWLPELLDKSVHALDSNPQAGFVFSDAHVIDEEDRITGKLVPPPKTFLTFQGLLNGNFIPHLTGIIRRNVYHELGGMNLNLYCTHDWDLWLRAAHKYPFIHIGQFLAKYRKHTSNVTIVQLDQYLKNDLAIYDKPEFKAEIGIWRRRWLKAKIYDKFAALYCKAGMLRKAGDCYFMTTVMCPWFGVYFWPAECKNWRFTLPYRIGKIYFLAVTYWWKALFSKQEKTQISPPIKSGNQTGIREKQNVL